MTNGDETYLKFPTPLMSLKLHLASFRPFYEVIPAIFCKFARKLKILPDEKSSLTIIVCICVDWRNRANQYRTGVARRTKCAIL